MVLTLFGCENDDTGPRTDILYFPLKTGFYQEYAVDEKRYEVNSDPVESTYRIRMQVVDSFPASAGGFVYVIHRSKSTDTPGSWVSLDTWSVRRDGNTFVVAEGNTSFVKLIAPIEEGGKWDGNAFNTMDKDEYVARDVGKPFAVDDQTFDNTITVEQESNEDPIVFHDVRREVYAREVGLIYKKVVQLKYCTTNECLGLQRIDEGIELEMRIVDYGTQ